MLEPDDALRRRAQHLQRGVGVAVADRAGQRRDPAAEAVHAVEHDDPVARGRPDDVAEHRAGLDRGELAGVADEHEPRVGPHRLDEPRHQRQRDHRGLVDDDHVVREPVAAVVAEAAVAAAAAAEQPVQRRGVEREQRGAHVVGDVEPARLVVDGLLEPRGGLAGRRGERDQRRRGARPPRPARPAARRSARRSSSCRCPARPRRPRAAAGPRRRRRAAGRRRPARTAARARPPARRRATAGRASPGEAAQVRGDLALLAPVAVEVEARALEPQRPVVHERARRQPRDPRADVRPRQRGDVDGLLDVDDRRVAHGREVDVDVPEPRRADGERGGQRDVRVVLAGQRQQPHGDVHVGGRQHAGLVERAQRRGRPQRAADVERVGLEQLAHRAPPRVEHVAERRHQRARRPPREHAARRAVDARHSGPVIPRRNR